MINNLKDERRRLYNAGVVLLAVFALTLSLATRYYSPWDASSATVKTIQKRALPDAKRQRLTKNAAIWIPPVFSFTVLQARTFSVKVVPIQAPKLSVLCDESLYNRPPPAFKSIS